MKRCLSTRKLEPYPADCYQASMTSLQALAVEKNNMEGGFTPDHWCNLQAVDSESSNYRGGEVIAVPGYDVCREVELT